MNRFRFSISRKGLTIWVERFRDSMFWQQNNLTSFKEFDNSSVIWVSGGLGELIRCSVPTLQMLGVAVSEGISAESVPLPCFLCLHAGFLHGSRYCSGKVKLLFRSLFVAQSASPVQCLLISLSQRRLALLSDHALDCCLLCPCVYLRGLIYL